MLINLSYRGINEIKQFCDAQLEIALPELHNPYKYINNIEYGIIKNLTYKISLDGKYLINSDDNDYGKICGTTLEMYDYIENRRQIHLLENGIITFSPYEIYRGCLDLIIGNEMLIKYDNSILDNLVIEFSAEIELTPDIILIRDEYAYIPINDNDLIINKIPTELEWNIINTLEDCENPTKRSKYNT